MEKPTYVYLGSGKTLKLKVNREHTNEMQRFLKQGRQWHKPQRWTNNKTP